MVLDYIRVLIWPVAVLVVVFRFRGGIANLVQRVLGESQELSASGFGLGITAKFSETAAKFNETVANLEDAENVDAAGLNESIKQAAHEMSLDQFRALTATFSLLPIQLRRDVATEIADFAGTMDLEDLLVFAESPQTGERVGAAIGLRVHVERSDEARRNPAVLAAIDALLEDRSSLVRYRAAEAVRAVPELLLDFRDELTTIAKTDRNADVRQMAHKALDAS